MCDRRKTILLALGGNALATTSGNGTYDEQLVNARQIAELLAELHGSEHRVVVTHGNGPQVGALALQQESARDEVPPMPLHAVGAMTQGLLGYLLLTALSETLPDAPVAALVTRVVVDLEDPAFATPSKPIGPFYSRVEAERLARERGWRVVEDSQRGWRRVVVSPEPQRIVEAAAVSALVERDVIVVAVGGGGIPVALRDGRLEGVDAVIDKDRAAAVLAKELGVDLLLLLTAVPRIALDFGTPRQREVDVLRAEEARRHLLDGQFPAGSMGPKVEAALRFVEDGGEAAVVCDFEHAGAAIAGRHGTRIMA